MASPFEFETEAEAKRVLKLEGDRLLRIAREVWNRYEATYQPKVYAEHLKGKGRHQGKGKGENGRTGRSAKSIQLKQVFKIDSNTWGIELTFKNDLVYHESVFGSSHPKGHSIMLISSGWNVKRGWHKKIKRFGSFGGFDFLGQVVREFNSGKHQGVVLEVQWSGKYTK